MMIPSNAFVVRVYYEAYLEPLFVFMWFGRLWSVIQEHQVNMNDVVLYLKTEVLLARRFRLVFCSLMCNVVRITLYADKKKVT